MYQLLYYAPAADVPSMVRTEDDDAFDPELTVADNIRQNNYWDALACCHGEFDRISYEGCTLVVLSDVAGLLRYSMHDNPTGPPDLKLLDPA